MGRLDGRVAIVTGAGRGIGRGHARLLAEHGARVIVNDLGSSSGGDGADAGPAGSVAEEIVAAGGEAAANTEDVADWEGARRLVQQALDTWGRLDILVNNAGIIRNRMVFNLTERDWDDVVRVHGKGHFAPTHHACVHWRDLAKRTGGPVDGRLVHTSSVSGLFYAGSQSAYAFAKAGIAAFGVTVAKEMARYGVTSNVIAPAALTRLTGDVFPAEDPASADDWRRSDPDNIAPLVVFLCLPETADVSGQIFNVGGGEVSLVDHYRLGPSVAKNGRWTAEELLERSDELFAGRPRAVAPSSGPGDLADLTRPGHTPPG